MRFCDRISKARFPWVHAVGMAALSLLGGCGGAGADGAPNDTALPAGDWLDGAEPEEALSSRFCSSPQPGESPLRRLTNLEYENTLLDLGFDRDVVAHVVESIPSEPESLGFRNGASALTVTSLMAEKYASIAEQLSAGYAYPCELTDPSVCADQMIENAGARLHRRPLTPQESAQYRAIYDLAVDDDGHDQALGWVMRAMLQSPHFLYRVEIPDPDRIAPVEGYELANRLSYTLWQSPPDAQLVAAATSGALSTPDQVLEQAVRMMKDPKAEHLLDFFEQWLDLDELHTLERDDTLYPDLSPQLGALMRAEAQSFILDLLRTPGSSFSDLLGATYTFANAELAEHYGLSGADSDAFVRVEAPGRRGILTQAMLAVQDGPTRTSIVRRGLKIRTDFMCQIVPAPPDTVNLTLDGIGSDLTQAQRLQQHRQDPVCANCHSRMDPIGQIFEGFDAVGRSRTVDEYGNPTLAEGELTRSDVDGPISGISELSSRLSESEKVRQCYVIQNLRYYLGREVGHSDLCTQAELTKYWQDRDMSLTELIVGITLTDAFLYKARRVDTPVADTGSDGGGQ